MPNGTLDPSFGNNGKVVTDLGNGSAGYNDIINSIALQPDGKIVAGGSSTHVSNPGNSGRFALARYTSDGNLDASFGNEGKVITNFDRNDDRIKSIVLQPDGKIVAAGFAGNLLTSNFNMALARYENNGALDRSFGDSGKVTLKFNQQYSAANSVILQSDAKIIVGGYSYNLTTDFGDFALARLNIKGNLDSSFGDNGTTVTNFGDFEEVKKLLLQEDGKIVAAGRSVQGAAFDIYNFALARYNGDASEQPAIAKLKTWIRNNMLGWYTTNNSSVNYYSIQHSSNNSNFTEAKRVTAKQTENLIPVVRNHEEEAYSYALRSAESGYYRVAAVKKDGSIIYSDVVSYNSTNNQINNSTVTIYPNPAKNILRVSGLNTSANTTLTVVNAQGNVFKTVSSTNNSSADINVNQLKQGTYYLQVKEGEQSKTYTFMKE